MQNSPLKPITYAYLETTNYCNLKCSFCNREEVIGKLQHMSIEKYEVMLQKLSEHPITEAKLMGMGEPFLHPKFDEICKLFKSYFPKAFLIVATNCQYRFTERIERALEHIDLLYFSIDGYKESYEKDRAPAKWEKLMKFLDDFKNSDRKNCRVTVNYVVNPNNIYDIQKVNDEILIPYNLEELRLNIAQDWSEDKTMVGGYKKEDLEYLKKNWKANIKGKSKWDYNSCFWPENGVYITVDGRVLMCALNTSASGFGNIFIEDIDVIRQNKEFSKVRNGCKENKPEDHCKNCSYKELTPILDYLSVNN